MRKLAFDTLQIVIKKSKMKIKVKLFGILADVAKQSEIGFENVNDTDSLLLLLKQKHPGINQTRFIIAVNKGVINANCTLH